MSTLLQAAAEEHEMWGGVNHWVIGALVLAILLGAMAGGHHWASANPMPRSAGSARSAIAAQAIRSI